MKNKKLTYKIGSKEEIHLVKMNLKNDQIAALKAAKEVQRDMFSLERRLKETENVNDLEKIVDEARNIVQRYNNLWTVYTRVNTLRMDKKNSLALLSRAEEKLRDNKNSLSLFVYEAEKLYKQIFKIDVDNASIMEIQSGIILCRKLREMVNKGLRFDQKNILLSGNSKIADDMEKVFKEIKTEYKKKKTEEEEALKRKAEEKAKRKAEEEEKRKAEEEEKKEKARKRKEEQNKKEERTKKGSFFTFDINLEDYKEESSKSIDECGFCKRTISKLTKLNVSSVADLRKLDLNLLSPTQKVEVEKWLASNPSVTKTKVTPKDKNEEFINDWLIKMEAAPKDEINQFDEYFINKVKKFVNEGRILKAVRTVSVALSVDKPQYSSIKIKTVKHYFKDLSVRIIPEFKICVNSKNGKSYSIPMVVAQQETQLMRSCEIKEMILSDQVMTIRQLGVDDIININLDSKTLLNINKFKNQFLAQFDEFKKGFFVKFNRVTGEFTKLKKDQNGNFIFDLKENEECFQYKFLGITPSGLRSGTLTCSKTGQVKMENGKLVFVENDTRTDLLDKASENMYSYNFKDENNEVIVEDMIAAFKAASRLMQSNTSSKVLFKAKNFIIMNNIADNAYYYNDEGNKISCKDTKDGVINIAADKVAKAIGVYNKDVKGTCIQVRGASLKGAAVIKDRSDLITLVHAVLYQAAEKIGDASNYLEAGLNYFNNKGKQKNMLICINGKTYRGKQITVDVLKKALECVDIVGDWNAFKMPRFNAEWELVALKQANISESKAGNVINLMMQQVAGKEALDIIAKKTKDAIVKRILQVGIVVSFDQDGNVDDVHFDPNELKREYNNDSQFGNFLLKNDPSLAIKMPQLMKGNMQNIIKSIANLVNGLNPEIKSYYTVIQADSAPLFGTRILGDREFYCNDLPKDINEISAVRHPISTYLSVSTLKRVSREEIEKRILALDIPDRQKVYLRNEFFNSKKYAIIPASHDLMEKHDGMDYDIDAMQFIADAEIVAVLKRIPDKTIIINRDSDVKKDISVNKAPSEVKLENFIKSGALFLGENPDKDLKVVKEEKSSNTTIESVKGFASKLKIDVKNLDDSNKMRLDLDHICDMDRDYFLDPVDPIGVISTGFYNNCLLLGILKYGTDAQKAEVVEAFVTEFGCNGTTSYVSPLKRYITAEGHFAIELDKESCMAVKYNFANSKGSIQDLILYLTDCCEANRYPGETSLDAAKNNYSTVDMFNHTYFIRVLGSDKSAEVVDFFNQELYENYVRRYNNMVGVTTSIVNFFNINLLKIENRSGITCLQDGQKVSDFVYKNKQERKQAHGQADALGIKDSFYSLKEELIDFSNLLLVASSKAIESYLMTEEAINMRKEAIIESVIAANKQKIKSLSACFGSVLAVASAMNDDVDKTRGIEFDGMSKHIYRKQIISQKIANTFYSILYVLSEKEKAICLIGYAAEQFNNRLQESGHCPTLNSNLVNAFEKAFIEGYSMEAGEKIISVLEGKNVYRDMDSIDNKSVEFDDGVASIIIKDTNDKERELTLICENKRFSGEGIIKVVEKKPYVVFDYNTTLNFDNNQGVVFGVNPKDEQLNKEFLDKGRLPDSNVNFRIKEENGLYFLCSTEGEKSFQISANSIIGKKVIKCKDFIVKIHFNEELWNLTIQKKNLIKKGCDTTEIDKKIKSNYWKAYIEVIGSDVDKFVLDSVTSIEETKEKTEETDSSEIEFLGEDDFFSLFKDNSTSSKDDDVVLENTTLEDFLK